MSEHDRRSKKWDELLSIASHELRTPLTPIKIHLQALDRSLANGNLARLDSAQLRRTLESLHRQTDRLSQLVDDLLDVSCMSRGRIPLYLSPEPVSLAEIVRDALKRCRDPIARSGSVVQAKIPETIHGRWDRARIEQLVTHLLMNALQYGRGKPIEIRARSNGREATLEVEDHGIGITKRDQDRIFRRFERAVSSKSYGGLGLGLYIAQQIGQAHGGDIRVVSELGAGSTFIVELPMASY